MIPVNVALKLNEVQFIIHDFVIPLTIVTVWELTYALHKHRSLRICCLRFDVSLSIIINIPALTEERRKELAKLAKAEVENAKISIRTARKDANTEIKKSDASEDIQKNHEIDIQNLTDQYIKKADEVFRIKEKEILTV